MKTKLAPLELVTAVAIALSACSPYVDARITVACQLDGNLAISIHTFGPPGTFVLSGYGSAVGEIDPRTGELLFVLPSPPEQTSVNLTLTYPESDVVLGPFGAYEGDPRTHSFENVLLPHCGLNGLNQSDPIPLEAPDLPYDPPSDLEVAVALHSAVCLPNHLMLISFEFDGPVSGNYQAQVNDQAYQLNPNPKYPNRLYFFGPPPDSVPARIELFSKPDHASLFSEDVTTPDCGNSHQRDNPPPYDPYGG